MSATLQTNDPIALIEAAGWPDVGDEGPWRRDRIGRHQLARAFDQEGYRCAVAAFNGSPLWRADFDTGWWFRK